MTLSLLARSSLNSNKASSQVQPKTATADTSPSMTIFVRDPTAGGTRALIVARTATVGDLQNKVERAMPKGRASTPLILIHESKLLHQEAMSLRSVGIFPWTTVTLGGAQLQGGSQLLKHRDEYSSTQELLKQEGTDKGTKPPGSHQVKPKVVRKNKIVQDPSVRVLSSIAPDATFEQISVEECDQQLRMLRDEGLQRGKERAKKLAQTFRKNVVEGSYLFQDLELEQKEEFSKFLEHVFSNEEHAKYFEDEASLMKDWLDSDDFEVIETKLVNIQTALKEHFDGEKDPEWKKELIQKMDDLNITDCDQWTEENMKFIDPSIWDEAKRDGMTLFSRLSMAEFFKLLQFIPTDHLKKILDYSRTPLKHRYVLEIVHSAMHPTFFNLLDKAFATGKINEIDDLKKHFKRIYDSLDAPNQERMLRITLNRELMALMGGRGADKLLIEYRNKALDANADEIPQDVLERVQKEEINKAVRQVHSGKMEVMAWSLLRSHPDLLLCAERHDYSSVDSGSRKILVEILPEDESTPAGVIANLKKAYPELSQDDVDKLTAKSKQTMADQYLRLVLKKKVKIEDSTERYYISLTNTNSKSSIPIQRQTSEELIPFCMDSMAEVVHHIYFYQGMDEQVFWFTKSPSQEEEESSAQAKDKADLDSVVEVDSEAKAKAHADKEVKAEAEAGKQDPEKEKPVVTLHLLDKGVKELSEVKPFKIASDSNLYSFLTDSKDLKAVGEGGESCVHAWHHAVPTLVRTAQGKALIVYSDFKFKEGLPVTHFYDVEQGKEVARASAASIFLGIFQKKGGEAKALFHVDSYACYSKVHDLEALKMRNEWTDQEKGYPQLYEVAFDSATICKPEAKEPLELIPKAHEECIAIIDQICKDCESKVQTAALCAKHPNWIFVEKGHFSNDSQRRNYVYTNKVVRVTICSQTNSCFEIVIQNLSRYGCCEMFERDESDSVKRCHSDDQGEDKDLFIQKIKPYSADDSSVKYMRHFSGVVTDKLDKELSSAIKHSRIGQTTQAMLRDEETLLLVFQDYDKFNQVFVCAVKVQNYMNGGEGGGDSIKELIKTGSCEVQRQGSFFCSYIGGNELLISNTSEPNQPDFIFTSKFLSIVKLIKSYNHSNDPYESPQFDFLTRNSNKKQVFHRMTIKLFDFHEVVWSPSLKGIKVDQNILLGGKEDLNSILIQAINLQAEYYGDNIICFTQNEVYKCGSGTEPESMMDFKKFFSSGEAPIKQMYKAGTVLVTQHNDSTGQTDLLFSDNPTQENPFKGLPSKNSGRILGYYTDNTSEPMLFVLDEELNVVKYLQKGYGETRWWTVDEADTRSLSQIPDLRESVEKMEQDEEIHFTESHIIIRDTCFELSKETAHKIASFSSFDNGEAVSSVRLDTHPDLILLETHGFEEGGRSFALAPFPFKRSIGINMPLVDLPFAMVSPSKLLRGIVDEKCIYRWRLFDIYQWRSVPLCASLQAILDEYSAYNHDKWSFVPQVDGTKLLMIFTEEKVCLVRFDFEGNFVRYTEIKQEGTAETINGVQVNSLGQVVIYHEMIYAPEKPQEPEQQAEPSQKSEQEEPSEADADADAEALAKKELLPDESAVGDTQNQGEAKAQGQSIEEEKQDSCTTKAEGEVKSLASELVKEQTIVVDQTITEDQEESKFLGANESTMNQSLSNGPRAAGTSSAKLVGEGDDPNDPSKSEATVEPLIDIQTEAPASAVAPSADLVATQNPSAHEELKEGGQQVPKLDKTVYVRHEQHKEAGLKVTKVSTSKEFKDERIQDWQFCLSGDYLVVHSSMRDDNMDTLTEVFHFKLDRAKKEERFDIEKRVALKLEKAYHGVEPVQPRYGSNFVHINQKSDQRVLRDASRIQLYREGIIDIFEVSPSQIIMIRQIKGLDKIQNKDQHVPMNFNMVSQIDYVKMRFIEEPNERSIFLQFDGQYLQGVQRMYSELDLIQLRDIFDQCQEGTEPESIDKELLLTCFHGLTFFTIFQDQIKLLQTALEIFVDNKVEGAEKATNNLDDQFLMKLTAVLLRPHQKQRLKAQKELQEEKAAKAEKEEEKRKEDLKKLRETNPVEAARQEAVFNKNQKTQEDRDRTRLSVLERNMEQVALRDILLRFGRLNPNFSLFEVFQDQSEFSSALASWSPTLLEEFSTCFLQTPSSEQIKTLEWPDEHSFMTFVKPNCNLTKAEVQKVVLAQKDRRERVVDAPVHVYTFDQTWMKRGNKSFASLTCAFQIALPDSIYETKFVVYLMNQFWKSVSFRLYFYYFTPYLVLLVTSLCYSLYALIDHDSTHYDRSWIVPLGTVIMFQWLYQLQLEVRQLMVQAKSGNFLEYLTLWNLVDIIYLVLLPITVVCSLPVEPWVPLKTLRSFAAMTSFCQLVKVYDWMRLIEATSFYIQLINETVVDIAEFMIVLLFTMSVFGVPLVILDLNRDSETLVVDNVFGFWFFDMLLNQYLLALGEFNLDNFAEGSNLTLCYFFFVGATFMSQITMLNMLIAIMGDTFERVVENKKINGIKTRMSLMSDLSNFLSTVGRSKFSCESEFLYVVVRDEDEAAAVDVTWEGPFNKMMRAVEARSNTLERKITKQSAFYFKKMQQSMTTAQARDKKIAMQVKEIQTSVKDTRSKLGRDLSLNGKRLDELKTSLANGGGAHGAHLASEGNVSVKAGPSETKALMSSIKEVREELHIEIAALKKHVLKREDVREEIRLELQSELASLKNSLLSAIAAKADGSSSKPALSASASVQDL